ncbi:MAG: hypothetical protein ACTHPS_18580, partial [Streptosporangiaceae bacterium]
MPSLKAAEIAELRSLCWFAGVRGREATGAAKPGLRIGGDVSGTAGPTDPLDVRLIELLAAEPRVG